MVVDIMEAIEDVGEVVVWCQVGLISSMCVLDL
jgi:hypothetical protein